MERFPRPSGERSGVRGLRSKPTMTDVTASPPRRRLSFEWLGVAPFIIFAVMFLILPTLYLIGAAFIGRDGQFTFDNIAGLFTQQIMAAYWISIRISGASAI